MWAGLQLELACTVRYKGVWVIPPLVSRNTKRIPQTKLLDDDADDVRQWVVARSNISSAGSVCACYFPAHLTESCTWLCSVYCVVILSRVANVTGLSPNVVTFLAGRRGQRFRGCLLEGGRLGEIIDRGGHGETPNPNRSQERRAFLPSWQRLAWWLLSCTGWGTGMLQDVATKTQLRVLNPPPPPPEGREVENIWLQALVWKPRARNSMAWKEEATLERQEEKYSWESADGRTRRWAAQDQR